MEHQYSCFAVDTQSRLAHYPNLDTSGAVLHIRHCTGCCMSLGSFLTSTRKNAITSRKITKTLAMDPLCLSVGLAGLLPLIASAITASKKYTDSVRSARKSIATLVVELEALQSNVANLHDLLKGDSFEGSDVRFQNSSVLLACCAACEAKLRSLCKRLGQEANENRSRFLWPFSEKEHQKTIQEFRNFSNWMQFALSVDGCRLLSRTSDDVLKLMGRQLEQFRTIQTLEADTLRILDFVEDQKRAIQVDAERQNRSSLLDWVSTLKHYQKHQLIQASRAPNTGT
jgi:hypothetical protein